MKPETGAVQRAGTANSDQPLLVIRNLQVSADTPSGRVRLVDGVDLDIHSGRTLAVVGESGSGKSMTFLAVMDLLPARVAVSDGDASYRGAKLFDMPPKERRALRGRKIAMIFQDSLTGLNPAFTVGQQVADLYRRHEKLPRREAWRQAVDLLDRVRIPHAASRARFYPHQLSGGMRQRVMIAMGIALQPDVLIADEPSTALDVTIQAQILDLLDGLRRDMGMALVLITHDLGVVARYADEMAVMYSGRIAEAGPSRQLFGRPRHPYTVALRRSIPRPDSDSESLISIPGQPALPARRPAGCAFHPRCFLADRRAVCAARVPELRMVDLQRSACHFAEELGSEDTLGEES